VTKDLPNDIFEVHKCQLNITVPTPPVESLLGGAGKASPEYGSIYSSKKGNENDSTITRKEDIPLFSVSNSTLWSNQYQRSNPFH
jgi:hypothetical protein